MAKSRFISLLFVFFLTSCATTSPVQVEQFGAKHAPITQECSVTLIKADKAREFEKIGAISKIGRLLVKQQKAEDADKLLKEIEEKTCNLGGEQLSLNQSLSSEQLVVYEVYRKKDNAIMVDINCGYGAKGCLIAALIKALGENDFLKKYENNCQQGSGEACLTLGMLYSLGIKPANKDVDKGKQYYELGCQKGNAESCHELANLIWPTESAKNAILLKQQAITLYDKACAGQFGQSCLHLATINIKGFGFPINLPKAMEYAQKSCEAGHGEGCTFWGFLLRDPKKTPESEAQREAAYIKGCQLDALMSCYSLGYLYLRSNQEKKQAQASNLFQKACDAGEAHSCETLAEMYKMGRGVKADLSRSIYYWEKACRGGEIDACQTLAGLDAPNKEKTYKEGFDKNFSECQNGQMTYCFQLSQMLALGIGTKKDEATARELAKKACAGGSDEACAALGQNKPAAEEPAK